MITPLHTVQGLIHNPKTIKRGWGRTTKAEGHFIIMKLLNRLRCDSSSEILSAKLSCLESKLRCEVAGCDPSPPRTHKLTAGPSQDRFPVSLSLSELVSLFGFGESVWLCESRTERISSWLWLTAALTHARVNKNSASPWRRRLPPSRYGFRGGCQCCQVRGFPPSTAKDGWARFV